MTKLPPLLPREKMKAYRKKMRENPEKLLEMMEADKQRKKAARQKEKDNVSENTSAAKKLLSERRKKEREKKARWRSSKKNEEQGPLPDVQLTLTEVYSTRQAAGKALKRLRTNLPSSPRKQRALTLMLALEAGNKSFVTPSRHHQDATGKELTDKVANFYNRDDISWAAPGMRDAKAIRIQDGIKNMVQKRFMTMNIIEAYQIFKAENSEAKVGKSKFFELRPKHVQLLADIPHNVCICKTHGNMESLLEGIAKVYTAAPRTGRSLIEKLVCERESSVCMLATCDRCSHVELREEAKKDEVEEEQVKWRRWEDINGRPVQVDVSLSVTDAIAQVNSLLREYKIHCFIKDEQSNLFKTCKEDIPEKRVIMQVDFAENYAAISQDEVQSAHWSHSQITVFTGVAWLRDSCESFVVVSDDLNHDKVAVWSMLNAIIKCLKKKHLIDHIMVFSDGCAAQFKNRYTMTNICFMREDFGVSGEWAFFASSHGKGAVDAVGGTVKRSVWRAVKGRKVIVKDAETFHKVASEQCTGINVLYIPFAELRSHSEFLEDRWKEALPIATLQKQHIFQHAGPRELYIGRYASNLPRQRVQVLPQEEVDVDKEESTKDPSALSLVDLRVGDWVLVRYDTTSFPGEVKEIGDKEVRVSVMVPSGSNFKWPSKEDSIFYSMENVIRKLNLPHVKSARGTFEFFEKW